MKNRRMVSVFLFAVMMMSLLPSCGAKQTEAGKTQDTISVTDCHGRTVEVPADPQSICTLCPYSGTVVVMLGYGDKVTSTCNNVARSNLMNDVCPTVGKAELVKNSGDINAEEILALKTDLIFVEDGIYNNEDQLAKLETMGIPYVVIGFETIEEQFEATRVIGKALDAEEKAEKYIEYFQSVIDYVSDATKDITDKPRVYHSVNEAVRTDEKGGYCAEWIDWTGVINISVEDNDSLQLNGKKSFTTLEQIYLWNPEMIVCNECGVDGYILSDPKWEGLEAVKNGKVYQIPVGITRMGHPTSVETPLAILWMAQTAHPDIFTFDYREKLREFYADFFDFNLSDEWIEAMLEGDNMRTPKQNGGTD